MERQRNIFTTKQRSQYSQVFAVLSWLFVAAMACIIFFMSSRSDVDLNTSTGIITVIKDALAAATTTLFGHPVDVSPIGHFTEFFLLGGALANALRLHFSPTRACVLAVVIASLYGVTDELHQIFVPGRTCDPLDWLVDTVAALLAAVLVMAFVKLRQKRKNSHPRGADISL